MIFSVTRGQFIYILIFYLVQWPILTKKQTRFSGKDQVDQDEKETWAQTMQVRLQDEI